MAEPKVRFKRDDGTCYPAWIVKNFSESFDALNNNSFSRDMLNYDGGDVKNIHYGDILVKFGDICNIQNDNVPYVNDGVTIQKYAHLKDGDVILADTAEDETVGKAIEIYNTKNDVVISGLHTIACRPVEVFAPKYLGYYMNSPAFHDQLRPYMQGVKVTSISRSNIADAKLSFPKSSEEQQKIADFLSSVDDVIAASVEEIVNLETQKKAVMKKIFSREVRFKREDGSEFPEWEEHRISDFCKVSSGEFVIKTKQDDSFPYPVFNGGTENTGYYSEYNYDGSYILMSSRGANAGYVNKYIGKLWCGNSCYAVKIVNDAVVGFEFLYHACKYHQYDFLSNQQTGSIPAVNKGQLEDFILSIPIDFEEQRLISDFLSDFDEAITAAKKELELWKELKKGLLQQMFV